MLEEKYQDGEEKLVEKNSRNNKFKNYNLFNNKEAQVWEV
jgi:hypothetical protein